MRLDLDLDLDLDLGLDLDRVRDRDRGRALSCPRHRSSSLGLRSRSRSRSRSATRPLCRSVACLWPSCPRSPSRVCRLCASAPASAPPVLPRGPESRWPSSLARPWSDACRCSFCFCSCSSFRRRCCCDGCCCFCSPPLCRDLRTKRCRSRDTRSLPSTDLHVSRPGANRADSSAGQGLPGADKSSRRRGLAEERLRAFETHSWIHALQGAPCSWNHLQPSCRAGELKGQCLDVALMLFVCLDELKQCSLKAQCVSLSSTCSPHAVAL